MTSYNQHTKIHSDSFTEIRKRQELFSMLAKLGIKSANPYAGSSQLLNALFKSVYDLTSLTGVYPAVVGKRGQTEP